ncbi:MAG: hypothetical protein HFG92_05555 [Dorea sp.]|jgi:hypothetical protein|nr:hypothetical protein [Dorea sp.]
MGLSWEEKERRKNDSHVRSIQITDKDSGKDFLFISYKSDDWEVVLHEIVYELHKNHGLRVYFDGSFDEHNALWIDQFPDNMDHPRCKGVLAFIDDKYATSYATLLELMCSQSEGGDRDERLPVIPVNLGTLTEISDEGDTGLGLKTFEDGTKNINAEEERALFDDLYVELKEKSIITGRRYKRGRSLSKKNCSKIMHGLLQKLHVNENYYEKGMDMGSFCRSLENSIRDVAGDTVFEELETIAALEPAVLAKCPPVESVSAKTETAKPTIKRKKTRRMKLAEMVEKGIVQTGDAVYVQGHPEALGIIAGGNEIQYQGNTVSLNQYVKQAFGDDASRNAYEYVYHKTTNKLLTELRDLVPPQESLEAADMELGTEESAITVDTASDLPESVPDLSNQTTDQPEPEADEIIRPAPLTLLQSGTAEKIEDTRSGFREGVVYKYRFFGETASLKILSVKKGAKVTKVDAILLAGSAVKKLWEGGSVDYRMANGGKKSAKILYDRLLPGKVEEFKEGYLKITEDILIKDVSLSAIATMVSGASVAPVVAWRE